MCPGAEVLLSQTMKHFATGSGLLLNPAGYLSRHARTRVAEVPFSASR
jgi:hypothetical protein